MIPARARPGVCRAAAWASAVVLVCGVWIHGPFAGEPESDPTIALAVPLVKQSSERCGPAALAMAMRYHGAGAAALAWADSAYDPVLRGALITRLAECARRAGFAAQLGTTTEDSLLALLGQGLPPIVLYDRGVGRIHRGHYGVLVGWDPGRHRFTLHDGGGSPRTMSRSDFARRWQSAGAQALVIRPGTP